MTTTPLEKKAPGTPGTRAPESFPGAQPVDTDKVVPDTRSPGTSGAGPREYGEGNYKAAKEYDDAAARYAKSGQVEQAARDAAPRSAVEADELANAEREGRRRSKGGDDSFEQEHEPRVRQP